MSIVARKGDLEISTNATRMDILIIHNFLTNSYWAKGVSESTVRKAIANSLCFGLFRATQQIGFARVITDRATFAYLADVFVVEEFRGRGLAKWLVEEIVGHTDLQNLRRWLLATRDAHELYRKFGFTGLTTPARFMERHDAEAFTRPALDREGPT